MKPFLEVRQRSGTEVVPLDVHAGRATTIGKGSNADVRIVDDRAVSRLHASVEPIGAGWCVRDLGSRNGTYVNGIRIWSQKALHPGDEVRMGSTNIVFRSDQIPDEQTVTVSSEPPRLTSREYDVLVALCRPLVSGTTFTQPATIRQMASELVVSPAAVKQHLARLYDKFGVYEEPSAASRRVRLANEALARGAVRLSDLQHNDP
ncbi:MAG: FHA domain-containing protein [Actinobacteria bacterium]|nr:FHA domain-containing protein [Actinomycetota bacterium]MCL5446658.1 FHA domain-containing protein [Actinomycetota bacterium]